jgi:glycosyltransferase involved in cell wall biosynthesis
MFRLNESLRRAGADSKILCERKTTGADYVLTKPGPSLPERLLKRVTQQLGLNEIHRISSFWLHRHPAVQQADILHFHGIHGGFFSYLALPTLTARKPVVFTLRDMWAMTGHCAVPMDCTRWRHGCGKCPYPKVTPPIKRDATRIEWKLKNLAYSRSKLTFIALSNWVASQARESMLARFPIHTIPNGVDIELYQPRGREDCRRALGIPQDSAVLMFAATNVASRQKGGDLLLEALRALPGDLKERAMCLVMGNGGTQFLHACGVSVIDLGYISNERLKAIAYVAADVYVSASRGEAFGQTILESMSCGTPVVAFRIGPTTELVRHGRTGYAAAPLDSVDLSRGIAHLLRDREKSQQMGSAARKVAEEEYRTEIEARRHLALYEQILARHPSHQLAG